MKEKEQSAVCVDDKTCNDQTRTPDKEIFDDSCFKTPIQPPPRKGCGRRRGTVTRNGQANTHESPRRALPPVRSTDCNSHTNRSPPSSSQPNSKLASCSCSLSYIASVWSKSDLNADTMNEILIDEFSLVLFKNKEDFQAFQTEIDEAKAKEEAEQRKRQYEENVRLGLVKKKGRKSKVQIAREKKEEKRRLRRERKEQRRKERKEREKEGISLDPKERKARKERREKKREKKERKLKERKERQRIAAEKKEAAGEKKERKPRKPRDPNAPKKPRQPRQPKASTSNNTTTEALCGEGLASSALVPVTSSVSWMNDSPLTVCAASPLPAAVAATPLKRPLDSSIRDQSLTNPDKRLKLDAAYDDYKNGLIGIAVKSDTSAVVGASPPGAVRVATASGTAGEAKTSLTPTNTPWNNHLSTPPSATPQRTSSTTLSSAIETTHPVDPGHNAPSTSVAPSVPSTSVNAPANSSTLPMQGTASLFVNTSMAPPNIASAATVVGQLPTGSGGVLSARDYTTASSMGGGGACDPRSTPQSALLDPLRQAFLSNPSFAASLNAAAGFGNAFLAGAPPNAAAAAFPFLAAQILQQQQQAQQSLSLPHSVASSMAAAAQPSVSSSSAAMSGAMAFPPGAALGPQLAGAALLGRTMPPTASLPQPSLPIKAKQGRWCSMHVKIAYEISSRKERRGTPQPSMNHAASSQNATTNLRTSQVAPPLCPPSTSNAHLAGFTGNYSNNFSAMAAAGALQPPFGSLSFQQLNDPSKLVRQTATPKPPQGRPASTLQRATSTQSGLHLPLGGTGMGSANSLQMGAQSLSGGMVGASMLPVSGSLTNGTSDAAAQAAMFAALAQSGQQPGAGLQSSALSSNPFLLSAAQQQHSLATGAAPSQSQSVFPSQRLFDPSMTAAVLQQMQSMEAMRQSAAAAQMNAQQQHSGGSSGTTALDLMRMHMAEQQQMMDRYAVTMSSSSATPSAVAVSVASANHSLDLMHQQLFAAQLRQQQQQQQVPPVSASQQVQQPSLETLLEMQRQQQQQQLLNASRAAAAGGLPAGYGLQSGAVVSLQSAGYPQSLFNASQLMSMGGAAAANLSLYGKNPYSNTLEQLARQKRDGDMMQPGR